MSDFPLSITNPPIVEAVVDIDCDLPPGLDLPTLENPARDLFRDSYPKFQTQWLQENGIEQNGNETPKVTTRRGMQAFQFLQEDKKQLVQVRRQGFSFNRLAPYSSLDDYLPEIKRTWGLFVELVKPVQIRRIRLRYINRILLPMSGERLELEDYLKVGPRLPDEDALMFVGFFNQHKAVESATENHVNIILTAQPVENDHLPVIFDISVAYPKKLELGEWSIIVDKIQSLRNLKNRVFRNTLTQKCLNLFQ